MPFKDIPKFYPIIDTSLVHISDIEKIAGLIIEGGAEIIQLRGKDISTKALIEACHKVNDIAKKNRIRFIVNDRVDIAVFVDADGVHLGQDDLLINEARRILGKGKIIGISTHNLEEAVTASKNGADYISFGPIFSTKTKRDAQEPKGISGIKKIVSDLSAMNIHIPITAIGGITLENARDVLKAGAVSIAVISDILKSNDIKERVEGFLGVC